MIRIHTPKGWTVPIEIVDTRRSEREAACAVVKDAGDDPDITDGMILWARVSLTEARGVEIVGGKGVGRVTRPGLSVAVGGPAINPVPRRMILSAVLEEMESAGYKGGLKVVIEIPEGEELAKRTFNPRLGIEGGLSILGTTGIVEPMSDGAFQESLLLELRQKHHRALALVPGNIGRDYCLSLGVEEGRIQRVGNFVGALLEGAVVQGVERVLFAGHIGKLTKVAGGAFHTHNRVSDGRMATLAAHLLYADLTTAQVRRIYEMNTTEEAVEAIYAHGATPVLDHLARSVKERLEAYVYHRLEVEVMLFSYTRGLIARTLGAEKLIVKLKEL
jgi:cobalt-precorrin-5B (C1)-methyltransferase